MSTSAHGPVLALDTSTPSLVTGLVTGLVIDRAIGADADSVATAQSLDTARAVENTVDNTRAHNELLMPKIMELLDSTGTQMNELAAIVVGCGPGPFSGLRVGMATASGLGHALGIKVYGVCSHDAIAWRALNEPLNEHSGATNNGAPGVLVDGTAGHDGGLLVATDARRRETYWARYGAVGDVLDEATGTPGAGRGIPRRTAGPEVGPAEELLADASRVVAHPTIAARMPEKLRARAEAETIPAVPSARGLVAVADFAAEPQPLTPLYLRRPDAKEPAAKPVSAALRWADR